MGTYVLPLPSPTRNIPPANTKPQVALSPLSAGETLFRLPRTSCLTPSTSSLPPLTPADALSSLSPWLQLTLLLVHESRPESPRKPYLDLLPAEFDMLMYWTPRELEWLRGSKVVDKIGHAEAAGCESESAGLWEVAAGSRGDGAVAGIGA